MILLTSRHMFLTVVYLSLLVAGLSTSSFLPMWLFMEFSSLVFFILLFSSIPFNISSPFYFVVQSLASITLLFAFLLHEQAPNYSFLCISYLFLAPLGIKLGIFPFNFWYSFGLSTIPALPLFIALTSQNLLPLLIYSHFFLVEFSLPPYFIFGILAITALTSTTITTYSSSLISLLIISSIFNSIWLLVSCSFSLSVAFSFLGVYSLLLLVVVVCPNSTITTVSLFSLIGLPPFPLFFVKFLVLYLYFLSFSSASFITILFLITIGSVALFPLYFNYLSTTVQSQAAILLPFNPGV